MALFHHKFHSKNYCAHGTILIFMWLDIYTHMIFDVENLYIHFVVCLNSFFFYYTGFVLCCFTSFCFHLFLFLFHCIILPLCKSVWFCSLHNTFFFALCVMCLKYSLQIVHNSQNQEDWDSVFMLWVVFSTWSVFVLTGKLRLCVWF